MTTAAVALTPAAVIDPPELHALPARAAVSATSVVAGLLAKDGGGEVVSAEEALAPAGTTALL